MDTRPGSAAYNPPPAFTNNTPTVDPGVRSQGDLINVSTVLLVPPVLKLWVDLATNTLQAWTLQADALGLLPADYNAVSNVKSWHQNPAVQFVAGGVTSPVAGQFFFSNSNNVSFGLNGSTITATATVASTQGNIVVSASGTSMSVSTINFSNSNNVTFGFSNNSVMTASASIAATVFSNSNNVSFGLNGSTVTATVASSQGSVKFSAGASSASLSAITFSNSNNVTFGLSTGAGVGTMTGSYALNVSAGGGTSNALSALTFANGNGVTFGLSTGAGVGTMTASHAINVSAGSTSNNLSAITFSNSNGISFGLNGSVVTAAGYTASQFEPVPPAQTALVGVVNALLSFRPILLPCAVSFSQINFILSLNMSGASSAVGTSGQYGFTNWFGLYSRSAVSGANSTNIVSAYTTSNTVSGAWSCSATSISMSYGWQTGTTNGSSSVSFSGQTTALTNGSFVGFVASQQGGTATLSVGEYWAAFLQSSSTAGGASASSILQVRMQMNAIMPAQASSINPAFGQTGTAASIGNGFGLFSTTTGGFPASVALSAIGMSSGAASLVFSYPYFNLQA